MLINKFFHTKNWSKCLITVWGSIAYIYIYIHPFLIWLRLDDWQFYIQQQLIDHGQFDRHECCRTHKHHVPRHASKKKKKSDFHENGSILIDIRTSIWPHVCLHTKKGLKKNVCSLNPRFCICLIYIFAVQLG